MYKRYFKPYRVLLLGIFIIGVILRMYVWNLHDVMDSDGIYYSTLGKNLFSGNGYVCLEGNHQWYYPPLYPINIGLVWLITNDLAFSSKFVSLFYGTLLIPLIFLVSDRIYGRPTSITAALLTAFHPTLIRFSSTDTAESQFVFLLVLILLLSYYAFKTPTSSLFCILGSLYGLLFLCKPAGIQYLAAYLVIFVIVGFLKKWGTIVAMKRQVLVLSFFLILAFPYLLFLKNHYGFWTLSELSTRNLARSLLIFSGDNPEKVFQLNDDGTELRYFTSSKYPGEHLSIIGVCKENPVNFIKRYISNCIQEVFLIFHNISLFAIPMVLFLYIHFCSIKWNSSRLSNESILFFVFIPMVTAPLISTNSSRWMLPMIPPLLIWTANGITELQKHFSKEDLSKSQLLQNSLTVIIVILWVLGTTSPFLMSIGKYAYMYPHEHKELGKWIKEHLSLSPETVIMSPSPHVPFYADTKLKIMPWGTTDQVINYAKNHNIQYVVIDDHFLGRARGQLHLLYDFTEKNDNIELVKAAMHQNGKKVRLFRLVF